MSPLRTFLTRATPLEGRTGREGADDGSVVMVLLFGLIGRAVDSRLSRQ